MTVLSAPSLRWAFLFLSGLLTFSPIGASAGMTPDEVKSFNRYKAEAETGFVGAQYILAECYRDGKGTITDASKAVAWYRKSSEQEYGHPAQRELGLLYAKGIGVPKDEIEAYAYLNLAGVSWDVPRDELRALEKKMSRDEITAGQKRTKELQKEIEAKIADKKAGK